MTDRHAERRERIRALARETLRADVLLITHLPNVRYLTGFSGSNAVLAIGLDSDDDRVGTDGRYVDQMRAEAPGLPTVIDRETLGAVLDAVGAGTVAVESTMTVARADAVRKASGEPIVADGLVEDQRAVKDEGEIAALARACSITAAAFDAIGQEMRTGQTELFLARRLEQLFGELGAEDRAFDTIVGSGPNSAIPHHQPGRRALEPGDLVVIDAGARVDGYHSDMTRTFVVAREPEDWQERIHATVLAAQGSATQAYLPHASARHIDAIARQVVAEAGLGDRFTHGLGHGVGLEIHEAPSVGARATGSIVDDMVITVEPGVYLPGRGGVRIEDTLVVTDAGPRILTEAPRHLRVVG